MVRILNVVLSNFMSLPRAEVAFSDKTINMIDASAEDNESVFEAIRWCLSDESFLSEERIPNREVLKKAKIGDKVTVYVELEIDYEKEKLSLRKEMSGTRQAQVKYKIDSINMTIAGVRREANGNFDKNVLKKEYIPYVFITLPVQNAAGYKKLIETSIYESDPDFFTRSLIKDYCLSAKRMLRNQGFTEDDLQGLQKRKKTMQDNITRALDHNKDLNKELNEYESLWEKVKDLSLDDISPEEDRLYSSLPDRIKLIKEVIEGNNQNIEHYEKEMARISKIMEGPKIKYSVINYVNAFLAWCESNDEDCKSVILSGFEERCNRIRTFMDLNNSDACLDILLGETIEWKRAFYYIIAKLACRDSIFRNEEEQNKMPLMIQKTLSQLGNQELFKILTYIARNVNQTIVFETLDSSSIESFKAFGDVVELKI